MTELIGRRLRQARERRALSVDEVAARVGIDPARIAAIEAHGEPTLVEMVVLCRQYEASLAMITDAVFAAELRDWWAIAMRQSDRNQQIMGIGLRRAQQLELTPVEPGDV